MRRINDEREGRSAGKSLCATLGLLCSSAVWAQQVVSVPASDSLALDEVTVTATRRSESLQAVPMSITAVTAATLEQGASTTFFDYGSTIPNLSYGYSDSGGNAGFANSRQVAIRGIAGSGTTGFYIDDTPVPASIDPKVVDVSQIEVLRGPQGTLYGALSMGGTIRMLTEQPDTQTLSIRAHGSVSDTDRSGEPNYQTDGSINAPLIDGKLAIRLSGVHEELGGYFQRYAQDTGGTLGSIGQSSTDGAQVAVLWQPTGDLSVTPRLLYQRTALNGLPFSTVEYNTASLTPIFIQPQSFVQSEPFNIPESASDDWTLTSLDIKYHQPFGTFVLSSSYFKRRTADIEDETLAIADLFGTPLLPASIEDRSNPRYQTEELRFASSFSGPFQLVGGLYFQHSNTSGMLNPPNYIPGLNAATGGALGTDLLYSYTGRAVQIEKAPYAEATYDMTDHWRAIVGLRTTQIQTLSGPVETAGIFGGAPLPETRVTQTIVTPKYSVQYRFSPDKQVYVTAAKGFRPGTDEFVSAPLTCGAQLAALGFAPGNIQVVPDTVWSYEVGAKTGWFNQRLTANVAVFRIDWSKIQQNVNLPCGASFLTNAGSARSQGGEFDLNARLTDGLTLQLSGGIDQATFTQTVPGALFEAGDRIPQVPRESFQIAANYTYPLANGASAFGHLDYRTVGDSWSTNNALTNPTTGRVVPLIRPAYRIADLRAGLTRGPLEYAFFVKNITNEIANLSDTTAVSLQAPGISRVVINPPRTLGIELRYRSR
jgi:iron complex outermembrane recepter protein